MPSATLSSCVDAVVDGPRETNPEINSGPFEFISVAMGDEQNGVDIKVVRAINGWTDNPSLPHQPQHIRGAFNLRGAIVPIVDLPCRFGQGATEVAPLLIIIVAQIAGRLIGLIGDRVLGVVAVEANEINPAPQIAKGHHTDCLSGILMTNARAISRIELAQPRSRNSATLPINLMVDKKTSIPTEN